MNATIQLRNIRKYLWIIFLVFFYFFAQASLCRGGGGITLRWDANPEASLAGYRVYYKTITSGYGRLSMYNGTGLVYDNRTVDSGFTVYKNDIKTASISCALKFADSAEGGVDYFFVITAFNSAGESKPSAETSIFVSDDDIFFREDYAVYDDHTDEIRIPAIQVMGTCLKVTLKPFQMPAGIEFPDGYLSNYYYLDGWSVELLSSCASCEYGCAAVDENFNIHIPVIMMDNGLYEVLLFINYDSSSPYRPFWIMDGESSLFKH